MSILIKVEMPKGCAFCRIGKRNGKKMVCPLVDEEWDIHDPMSADHRLDNCPLVPVPPHGRLIDADVFIGTIRPLCEEDKFAACTFETVKRLMVEHINNAPTIIPAEEGERWLK